MKGAAPDSLEFRVDGAAVAFAPDDTVLEACDRAGIYLPRLCCYPGLGCCTRSKLGGAECGLCLVRLGDGSIVRACLTTAIAGLEVTSDDPELRAQRLERLALIVADHPRACLTCPDRDGCARDQCTYGNPPEARCCDEAGRCELGRLISYLDSDATLSPPRGPFRREAMVEGRIRRESGLCVACGRCLLACAAGREKAGEATCEAGAGGARVLVMVPAAPAEGRRAHVAPSGDGLQAAGCTFCGRCVLVCPAGALTAPGEAGQRWLAERREKTELAPAPLPPAAQMRVETALERLGLGPGVLQLLDAHGEIVCITGVPQLAAGLKDVLRQPGFGSVVYVAAESEPLYTQLESELLTVYVHQHGHLPPGNDLGDDLFGDEDV